ncbi:MAG: ABC transporter substrate-binding protein [Salana multivorans]|uniref:ABC transporter substrate-binding protein n=1 Tax=Salana multivorans TaxID=120377 RepID=UPI0009608C75|nr:ABC transporter substrate-binding protein [Salana multivorans]MBN8882930.1 ABC transporter substrate-binding protein [Salana multivorans]OJX95723.1 MAG: hypothetical protein BGO96_08925 [Micrococcales bacterium 73-15]
MRQRPRPLSTAVGSLALAGLLGLAACAGPAGSAADPAGSPASSASPSGGSPTDAPATDASPTEAPDAGYSFTADNCGVEVSRTTPPERIVTVKSAMTELVSALGAADRIVGVAYQDGELAVEDPLVSGEVALGAEQDLAGTLTDVPELSDRMPSNEAVLSVEPDLVLAGWESVFAADAAGERSALEALGVTTFVAPAACTQPPYVPDPLTFDDVFDGITQVGALLGTSDAAERVVAELRDHLAGATELVAEVTRAEAATAEAAAGEAPTVLWWSSGTDTPYVGAGTGAPQMILDAAGLGNVAGDLAGGWAPFSWEAAAAADPDYIVLVDSTWNSAEKKKDVLAGNPVTAAMSAVRDERYLVVPFVATEAGIGNVEAVWLLTEQRARLEGLDVR